MNFLTNLFTGTTHVGYRDPDGRVVTRCGRWGAMTGFGLTEQSGDEYPKHRMCARCRRLTEPWATTKETT
jgi:hypothetical protein